MTFKEKVVDSLIKNHIGLMVNSSWYVGKCYLNDPDCECVLYSNNQMLFRTEEIKDNEFVNTYLDYFFGTSKQKKKAWSKISDFCFNESKEYHTRQNKEKSIKKTPKEGWIYVYKQDNLFKIGKSSTEDCRQNKYITENPHPVELVYKIHVLDYSSVEKELHKHFKWKNHNREWFKLNDKDIEEIKSITEKYGTKKNVR